MVNVGNNFNNQFMRNFSSELLDIIEYEIQKKLDLVNIWNFFMMFSGHLNLWKI